MRIKLGAHGSEGLNVITSKFLESMSFLLMPLPIVAFLSVWLTTLSQGENWRDGFLKAAVLWGSSILLITELLSIFFAIRPATLALMWILIIMVSLSILRWQRGVGLVFAMRTFALPTGDRWWVLPLIPVAAIVIATAGGAISQNFWPSAQYSARGWREPIDRIVGSQR